LGAQEEWTDRGQPGRHRDEARLYRDAAEHLAYFLRNQPGGWPPAEPAKKMYADAVAKTGSIQVTVDMTEAEVVVDGAVVGKAPLADPVFVEPGRHEVEARLGARLSAVEVDCAVGAPKTVSLALAPDGGAAPRRTG
jgi:hypothetical protein